MKFSKLQAAGNDFIIVEPDDLLDENPIQLAQRICHRRYGIGADGLIVAQRNLKTGRFFMEFYNQDGSVANMCGNGLRCYTKYLRHFHLKDEVSFTVETLAGDYPVKLIEHDVLRSVVQLSMGSYEELLSKLVRLDDLPPMEETSQQQGYFLHVGVPHTVIFEKELNQLDVATLGSKIEKESRFVEGTNVNFVNVLSTQAIQMKTWERGAGLTLACGTGATATVLVAQHLNLVGPEVHVSVPGGELWVKKNGNTAYLIGDAIFVAQGDFFSSR